MQQCYIRSLLDEHQFRSPLVRVLRGDSKRKRDCTVVFIVFFIFHYSCIPSFALPGSDCRSCSDNVQFSPLTDRVVGGDMRDCSAEILFQSFLRDALVSSSGMDRDVHSLVFGVIHPAFPLLTTTSRTLQFAL